jgi:hypothetical protein
MSLVWREEQCCLPALPTATFVCVCMGVCARVLYMNLERGATSPRPIPIYACMHVYVF